MNKPITVSLLACLILVASCSEGPGDLLPPAAAIPVVTGPEKMLGQWNGPEGTFVQLAGASGKYAITIRNLDGPRAFQGQATGGGIAFERDGKAENIRLTNGAGTGMKWLADKKNCIVIQPGEGYCRD